MLSGRVSRGSGTGYWTPSQVTENLMADGFPAVEIIFGQRCQVMVSAR